MRSIDPDHPSIALLETRVASAQAPKEVGESTNPGLKLADSDEPSPTPEPAGQGGLGDLSLDSLSLDESFESPEVAPPPDFGARNPSTGPLSLDEFQSEPSPSAHEAGSPPDMWGPAPGDEPEAPTPDGYPAAFSMGAPAEPEPEPPSPRQEIEGLLARGDEAAAARAAASRRSRSGRASS